MNRHRYARFPRRSGLLTSGFIIVWMTLVGGDRPLQGSPQSPDLRTPADVYARVQTVQAELMVLCRHMGIAELPQTSLTVQDAAPREVYFQAVTLFQKADRLCFEHTRERIAPPATPEGDITPAEVEAMVEAALQCVRRVQLKYGLRAEAPEPPSTSAEQPSDVFEAIVQTNRQLNVMLDRRFAPSDVFQQVSFSVGYAAQLLKAFPDATSLPEPPEFEAGKRPQDVYRRLLVCVDRLQGIAAESGVPMLQLQIQEEDIQRVEPSDVYDIASLIVAELDYLHSRLPDAKPPREIYYVGRKFPSDVYQRAGMLEMQLTALEKRVQQTPAWLGQESPN